ncbi:MAG: M1 family aminopeptidase, partial [bacterium]
MRTIIITFAIAIALCSAVQAYHPFEGLEITDTPRPSPAFEARQIDVLNYELSFLIDPDISLYQLRVRIEFIKLTNDTIMILDFEPSDIDTSYCHGAISSGGHLTGISLAFDDSVLLLNTSSDSISEIGDTCMFVLDMYILSYSEGIYRDITPDGPIVYTLFWPSLARRVFPCVDHPSDRATCTMIITTPEGVTLAAGGELIDGSISYVDSLSIDWTYRYDDPICTYNIAFAVANYAAIETTALDGSLPIKSYAYPSNLANTEYDFARIPQMIELFDSLYGEYPYTRAGCAVTPMSVWGGGGAMEHQTIPWIGSALITGSRTYEEIIAHELCHQWFGDCIGISDWADFWLNEGMAKFSEVLWKEHISGPSAARSHMTGIETTYRNYATYTADFPIYDPESFLSPIPYHKAASWWRMLRWMIGDEDFFDFLQYYCGRFRFRTVVTDSIHTALEDFTGEDWDWFMDQWIYSRGFPKYGYYFESRQDSAGWFLDVWLKQTQTEPMCTLFTMWVPMEINAPDSVWEMALHPDSRAYYERIRMPDSVNYIYFDRDNA